MVSRCCSIDIIPLISMVAVPGSIQNLLLLFLPKITKPSAEFGGNIGIFGLKTPLHAYVLGIYIEPRSSTICIVLSMHVHVYM